MERFDKKRLAGLGLLLLAGFLYYIETQTLGFTLQCPLHQLTGLKCPGCGITTACIALLQGRFADAFWANAGLAVALPVLGPALLYCLWRWLRRMPPLKARWFQWLCCIFIVFLSIWGVFRNILHL